MRIYRNALEGTALIPANLKETQMPAKTLFWNSLLLMMITLVVSSCSTSQIQRAPTSQADAEPEDRPLTESEKLRLQRITSIFENGAPNFQYGYIENLHDGRGYTAGRVGFCTGTRDLLEVIKLYEQKRPNNALTPFIPILIRLGETWSGDVSALKGFVRAWKLSAKDPFFRESQDEVVDEMYYNPAMESARKNNIRLPMGKAIIYDTGIMHGIGEGADGLFALEEKTRVTFCQIEPHPDPSCLPQTVEQEFSWLHIFLAIRKQNLLNPANQESQAEWAQNAVRADDLVHLLETYNGQIPKATDLIDNSYYKGPLGPHE